MQAFHNQQEIKDKYVARMKVHIEAEELVRGVGYMKEYGVIKGCAVGCTLNSYSHKAYETELGIPEWMAHVEDVLFEGMSDEKSRTFPLIFLETINLGVNLDKIKKPFMIFILESTLDKFDHDKYPDVLNTVTNVIELYKSDNVTTEQGKKAYAAAVNAAYAAAAYAAAVNAAAVNAAYAAAYAAAAYAAAVNAAYAAAYAAAAYAAAAYANAVNAAYANAVNAAYANAADAAYANAAYAAAAYDRFADKLIELIKECK